MSDCYEISMQAICSKNHHETKPQLKSFTHVNEVAVCTLPEASCPNAVEAKNVCLNYGGVKILQSTDLLVPAGCIYALLGPSGCGKTTLLKCILGQKRSDNGSVRVFNEEVKGSVGVTIGYMPQEEGLYRSFTIEDTLKFFAKLAGITEHFTKSQIKDLCQLLELPQNSEHLVPTLSGGQKRRLSLAVSLIQHPSLLILDEPTVGVDVKLRRKIWHYLIKLTREKQTTVILTTHYISEANDANIVAFMKEGKIICETTPTDMFERLGTKSLETAFLTLCKANSEQICQFNKNSSYQSENKKHLKDKVVESIVKKANNYNGLKAHLWKNYITERHHKGISFFKIFIVMFQVTIYPILFKNHAYNIPVTVVDNDNDIISNSFKTFVDKEVFEIQTAKSLDKSMFNYEWDKWAVFYFPNNYTQNVLDIGNLIEELQYEDECNVTDENFKFHVYTDNIDELIRRDILLQLNETMARMRKNLSREFDLYFSQRDTPFNKVFTGDGVERNKNDILLAGEMLCIIFYMNLFIATIQLQIEYKNGFLERSFVAGLTVSEMLLSFTISAIPHAIIEAILLQTVFVEIFSIPITHRWFVFLLQMLLSVSGTLFGLAMSSLFSELICAFLLVPIYFDISALCGFILSGTRFPKAIKYLSKIIPPTQPIWSVRYLWHRHWHLTNFYVLIGLLPPLLSSLVLFLIAKWALRRKYLI